MSDPLREPSYFLLAALMDEPLHGYAIAQRASELSGGRVRLTAGTLYGALERLTADGLVAVDREVVVDGRKRRYHRLTGDGEVRLAGEAERLRTAAAVVEERQTTATGAPNDREARMRDRLLRLGCRAYPRAARDRDGAVVLDCARELAAGGSSPVREALGLLRSGLACRAGLARSELAAGPWRAALALLALPLAAGSLFVWSAGARGLQEGPGDWVDGSLLDGWWSGDWLGWWWSIGLIGAVLALIGVALRRRRPAVAGAMLSLVPLVHHAYQSQLGFGSSRYSQAIGYFTIDVAAAWIAPALLLVVAAAALPATGPFDARRLAWGVLPAAAALMLPGEFVVAVALGMLAAALAATVAGTLRARSHPEQALAGALLLAGILPQGVWLGAGLLPAPSDPLVALPVIVSLYGAAAVLVIALARRACAPPRAAHPEPPPAKSG